MNKLIDKGFIEGPPNYINETTRERILAATALTQNNNTNITCRALTTVNNFGVMFSEPAVLLVQGNNITTQWSNYIVYIHVHVLLKVFSLC